MPSCHKPGSAMFPKRGHQVASDCIGCHMPLQETNLIVFDEDGKKVKPRVRNHWIKVYSKRSRALELQRFLFCRIIRCT